MRRLYLDVNAVLSDQTAADILNQRNVGTYIDADDTRVDTAPHANKATQIVNIGEFIDPDGAE